MFLKWLIQLIAGSNEKEIKKLYGVVEEIEALEPDFAKLEDSDFPKKTAELRERLAKGETLDDILTIAFALCREASKRTIKLRHFPVQLLGGIVLHQGKIAEMKTGEGKTLVATLPAYLNAITGHGVHIVTVNEYLAQRDAEWMGPIYNLLGLSVGVILNEQSYEDKRKAYACDITYCTNNELGFDYLRDNMAVNIEQCVQKKLNYAIVDEVDSILIDEARTPLIISGQIEGATNQYANIYKIAKQLQIENDYTSDRKQKNIILTETGIKRAEKMIGVDSLYDLNNMDHAHILIQCLKAKEHFKKDIDYIIKDREVLIVDEFTGRIMQGRRYSDGLHQAIEAKENVLVKEENQTLASITFQNYFRMYNKLAGMTGTAMTEEAEFSKIYHLEVVEVPTNKKCVRQDMPDVIYKTRQAKYIAVVNQIIELNKKGIPVLVGTISIENSELVSLMLSRAGVTHKVLNAKHHEKEAEIITLAGQRGAITIATNMAGRGTDIVLGEGIAELGGLHILGTERHESRRIDNQLRGRAGRQGDPGYTRFYISLEDDLMKLFGSDKIMKMMTTFGLPEDMPIEHGIISRSIEKAQNKVEQYYFGIRKQVLEYDDVMNRQRNTIYALRRKILEGKNVLEKLAEISGNIANYLIENMSFDDKDDLDYLKEQLLEITGLDLDLNLLQEKEANKQIIKEILLEQIEAKKSEIGIELLTEIAKVVILRNIDHKWIDHLYNIDNLREGIGLRAYGQRDPLIEYKVEGFAMFKEMLAGVEKESLKMVLLVQVDKKDIETEKIEKELLEPVANNIQYSSFEGATQTKKNQGSKIGRNDACPCGSGKKYKKCCGNK